MTSSMTSKERVLATIRGEPVDRIPVYHLQFSGHAASVILGRPDVCIGGAHNQWLEMNALWRGDEAHREFVERCESDAVAITKACGMDMLRLDYWRWRDKPARKVDEHTFLFGDPDGRWYTMTYDPQIELFTRKDGPSAGREPAESEPSEAALISEAEELERRLSDTPADAGPDVKLKARIEKYPDFLVRYGGGTAAVDMTDVAQLLAVAYWPEAMARLLMARARLLAAKMSSLRAAGLDVDIAGLDFCSAQGPCMSPGTFRRVVVPAMKVLVDACHGNGMYYFYTSDGNFWPVADDMFETAGVDGWMETDRSAGMDLRKLRERYPRVTIQGNIRVQLLHLGTQEDVRREVMECMEVAHELGGVLVGASNLIMPGTPPENIETLITTIERCR